MASVNGKGARSCGKSLLCKRGLCSHSSCPFVTKTDMHIIHNKNNHIEYCRNYVWNKFEKEIYSFLVCV